MPPFGFVFAMINDFAYLWEVPHGRYFLVGSVTDPEGFAIWDSITDSAFIIEDDDVYEEVLVRMERAGVPIIPRVPEGPHQDDVSER
jgi:hypothetical protein